MARYLVVADQTATSPELSQRVRELAIGDLGIELVLLVPATPVAHLLTWIEGEARELARQRAESARLLLEELGAKVIRTSVGDASPLQAIDDELRENPLHYDAIIVCTLPLGLSRWLRLDLPHQVERRFALPVVHVVAEPAAVKAGR